MADILPFRPAYRRGEPKSDQGEFAEAINAGRRHRRTSRAGMVADVVDIGNARAVSDLEAVLARLGRPMSELEVVLVRFGVAILERERQQHAARDKPE